MKILALILVSLPLIWSCSKSSKSESFTYDFTQNGCPTGSHTLSSQEEKCETLKNDQANGSCAWEMRKKEFEAEGCPGTFSIAIVSLSLNPEVPAGPAELKDSDPEPSAQPQL